MSLPLNIKLICTPLDVSRELGEVQQQDTNQSSQDVRTFCQQEDTGRST